MRFPSFKTLNYGLCGCKSSLSSQLDVNGLGSITSVFPWSGPGWRPIPDYSLNDDCDDIVDDDDDHRYDDCSGHSDGDDGDENDMTLQTRLRRPD